MASKRIYRLPQDERFARVVQHRGNRVRVTTREGHTYQGRLLAVGRALHGTSTDWLALAHAGLDRFVSLATIETIDRIPEGSDGS
jgi:hypothetical protein